MPSHRHQKAFSLVEVIIAVALVGVLLTMIGGAVMMLDRSVANERVFPLSSARVPDADLGDYGFTTRPNYALAPSRVMEAKADSLWRQVQVLYDQAYAVTGVQEYVIHNFAAGNFIGASGRLTSASDAQLLPSQLADPVAMHALLQARFPTTYVTWDLAADAPDVDPNSYRAATLFFLAEEDRILGILRVRCYQFDNDRNDPYRYYDVALARVRWTSNGTPPYETWSLASGGANFLEDFSYTFVEDKRFPQSLVMPFTVANTGGGTSEERTVELDNATPSNWPAGKNLVIRAAVPGEATNISRQQVSYVRSGGDAWDLSTAANEWHVIIPDPGLSQGEDRARFIRKTPRGDANFNATLYNALRRQGRFACVFKVLP